MISIALYYSSLEHSGGIERVVVEQTRIFTEKGYSCVLLTEISPTFYINRIKCDCEILPINNEDRQNEWSRIIGERGVKYVICNSAVDSHILKDIDSIHAAGAKIINTIHFSFPSPMLFNEAWESFRINKVIGERCDAVATVSAVDALWWRALGCNAFHVQNPFTIYKHTGHQSHETNHNLVWVGRCAPQKQPLEAVKIMSEVIKAIPDAKLYMVGIEGKDRLSEFIAQKRLEKNIIVVPPTNEIGQYYEQAAIHLLTSITESFCLVIAEAKSYHIPTVMYDIPFLELIADGNGVEIVSQRDYKAAANKIVDLLNNPLLLKQKGMAAYSTLNSFNDNEVVACWETIFDSLESGNPYIANMHNPYETIVREVYSVWMNHCNANQWKIDFFDNIERATGWSANGIIYGFMDKIIKPLKKIKRKIK